MVERNGEGERFAGMVFKPEEQIIRADGSVDISGPGTIIASDADAALEGLKRAKEMGITFGSGGNSGKSAHYFSSSSWNSPWNPEGPKKNWRVDPPAEGAHLN